ncbi:MAG: stage II sporulation protein D [Oscillospiraceae bacterium]|nr:stage II sporulation protein D [Oscillospiraceae bacterium]
MKQHLIFGVLVLLLLLLLPLAALGPSSRKTEPPSSAAETARTARSEPPAGGAEFIDVARTVSGQVETIGMEEYLRGCVAGEMPLHYHEEALKAQAVACYSFARHRLEREGREAVSDSPASDQAYLSLEERRKKWGDDFEANEKKLEKAVAAVRGQALSYEGEIALAVFHHSNSGLTETAALCWGEDIPYLQSVASPGDRLSPEYSLTTVFSPAEIKTALKEIGGLKLGDDPAKWFGKAELSQAGTVTKLEVGGVSISGGRLRELLGLRSASFSVSCQSGSFHVKTVGYGHGVGMSQYGADFMARQGNTYKEILEHYYMNCTITEAFSANGKY